MDVQFELPLQIIIICSGYFAGMCFESFFFFFFAVVPSVYLSVLFDLHCVALTVFYNRSQS